MTAHTFGHSTVAKPTGHDASGWHKFTCGHCGRDVSGAIIAAVNRREGGFIYWLQCSACHDASVLADDQNYYPGLAYGPVIEGLPDDVSAAYKEARQCLSVNANTASEGMCRKILMHIAVDKGANEREPFAAYIDFLEHEGYVTPPMKEWVVLIKDHGNEANHKLPASDRQRAEGTLQFTAQLLRTVYE
ncbi:MAG: DUF4145 domain-containing protein, partial [Gammaproteobacteria bacterium]|nr:DUF4145 domain-containing protein [Gammaproteobacteria bacterium]